MLVAGLVTCIISTGDTLSGSREQSTCRWLIIAHARMQLHLIIEALQPAKFPFIPLRRKLSPTENTGSRHPWPQSPFASPGK